MSTNVFLTFKWLVVLSFPWKADKNHEPLNDILMIMQNLMKVLKKQSLASDIKIIRFKCV